MAAWLGVSFQLGLQLLGFPIERFVGCLVALYVLVVPDRWIAWLGRLPSPTWLSPRSRRLGVLAAAATAFGISLVRLPGAVTAGGVLGIRGRSPRSGGHPTAARSSRVSPSPPWSASRPASPRWSVTTGPIRCSTGAWSVTNRAIEAYRQVVTIVPGHAAGWGTLGHAEAAAGHLLAAAEAQSAVHVLRGDPELERLAKAPRLAPPGSTAPEFEAARAALTAGDPEEAGRRFLDACRKIVTARYTGAVGFIAHGRGQPREPPSRRPLPARLRRRHPLRLPGTHAPGKALSSVARLDPAIAWPVRAIHRNRPPRHSDIRAGAQLP